MENILVHDEEIKPYPKIIQNYEIDNFVDLCLKNEKPLSLNAVKTELENHFDCYLSHNDKIHIEKVYVEALVELWLNEASENALNLDDLDHFQEHIDGLKTIKTLQDCFSFSSRLSMIELPYNNLLKELSENSDYFKDYNKITTLKFKETFFAFIRLKSTYIQDEINFQQTLLSTIKKSKEVSKLFKSLHLVEFLETEHTDETRFRSLLIKIVNCQAYGDSHPLKVAARAIIGREKYVLVKSIHDMITVYLKPVEINEKCEEGRKFLQVKGEHIVIGQILKDVEGTPGFDGIEEVHFINSGVVHVDKDLNSHIWHGKNIVLCTETIIVSLGKTITWDVSGQDSVDEETSKAGSLNGVGLDGADGKSGESGGNVLVICNEIENGCCMKIVSNGGKGSKGQDGGDGCDGKDGDFIEKINFITKFPPPSKWGSDRKRKSLQTIQENIMIDIHSVKFSVMGRLLPMAIDDYKELFVKYVENLHNTYFEMTTKSGCHLTFSFYNTPGFSFCQSFLLYCGSNGEPGKEGGRGGFGGKGGFAGDISIMKNGCHKNEDVGIVICAYKGEDGQHGEQGRAGKPGKSGSDCAFIDSTKPRIPFINNVQFPKYFFTHPMDSQKLFVEYHRAQGPERIHCFHNGQYAEIKKAPKRPHEVHFVMSQKIKCVKELTDSNFQSKVSRKKNVCLEGVRKEMSENFNQNYLNLYSIEGDMSRIYEEISNEKMMLEKRFTENTRITRTVEFSIGETHSVTLPTDKNLPVMMPNVHNNKNTSKSLSDTRPMNMFVKSKERTDSDIYLTKDNSCDDANFYKDKYQLDVLDRLQKEILEYDFTLQINTSSNFIPKDVGLVDSTLIISNEKETFCEVESYLCDDSEENRSDIISKLEEIDDNEFCMGIFNLYLDEVSGIDEKILSGIHLQAYKKHYNWFNLKKTKNMNIKLLPILYHVTRDEDLFNKLVKAITELNIHLKIDIEHKMDSDPCLNAFYEKYREEVNKPFVWKSGLIPKERIGSELVEGYKDAILKEGPLSVFFREVIAYLFSTNILIYRINECNNDMVLVHKHNPKADKVVQILIRDNKCFKLKTDEDFRKVIAAEGIKGQLCKRIQLHMDLIKRQESYKEEFDKFISERPFLLHDYSGISKSDELKIKVNHMLAEDENINLIASSFEEAEEQKLISSRLEMLKHKYIGYQSFLCFIALHFKTEGNKLSVQELCSVVNFLLRSVIDSSSKSNVVSWIIAAHHQTDWIVEFLLLKLEMHLKRPLDNDTKITWRQYLNKTNRYNRVLFFDKLNCDDRLVCQKDVEEVLLLLSQVPYYIVDLVNLSLDEWKYYLKDAFWTNQIRKTGKWSEEQLKLASYYLVLMENRFGKDLCCKFIKMVESKTNDLESTENRTVVMDTLKRLLNQEIPASDMLLKCFEEGSVHEWEKVVNKHCCTSSGERDLNDLRELVKMSGITSSLIKGNIDQTMQSLKKVSCFIEYLKIKFETESDLKNWITDLLGIFEKGVVPKNNQEKIKLDKINEKMKSHFKEMQKKVKENDDNHVMKEPNHFLQYNIVEIFLSAITVGIYIIFEKTMLRNTQLLAIMIFLNTDKNVLDQMSTGEGKTFVIVAVAIMNALYGNKVDIITSSHVLAERDANNHKGICALFEIKVDHNCYDNIDDRKDVYSRCQIVYGELSFFQRDFLLDRAYNNNILGNRTFQMIIVDEVDSMLLDKANNVLYLSHDIPGLDKLVPLFVLIWRLINEPVDNISGGEKLLDVDKIKDKIIDEVYGQIRVKDISNLDLDKEKSALQTWRHLKQKGIIDSDGKILCEKFDENKIDEALKNCIHSGDVKYLLKKILLREKEFEIPNYLKGFVESHLDQWIESAVNALNLKNNIDYVVDIDRSPQSSDRSANIIIVDSDTGTDMVNSQWDLGLHQFLQLKHGCRMSTLSFKAVFISNVSYLKQYETLLGLTGTLGSTSDRDLLKQVYDVEFVTIPTAKPKQFFEDPPILCNNPEEWSNKIVEKIYKVTETRSALIICQSLTDVYTLEKRFKEFELRTNLPARCIQTYTRDYEEFNIKSLGIMKVIISTNLAGRGTDIQLSEQLIKNGGLHVCLSFLPRNSRIEEQAFGRSARNGQPGTGQMIFMSGGQNNMSRIIDLKKESSLNEIFRLSKVREHYETKIKSDERFFHRFLDKYKSLGESKHCQEVKDILQMACLDNWAFFLEMGKTGKTRSFEFLLKSISNINAGNVDSWIYEIQDPFQLTKLGLFYLKENDFEKAVKLFDHVIKTEPRFNEAAYYYKVAASTHMEDIPRERISNLICELGLVKDKLKKRCMSSMISGQYVDNLKEYSNVIQIDSFKQQQIIVSQMYETFHQSINDITGIPLNPQVYTDISDIGPSSIIFNDLLQKNILQYFIKKNVSESDLNFSYQYGICPKSVKNFLDNVDSKYNDKKKTPLNEELIVKELKKSALLPTRELFWKELVSIGILEDEEKFVFVDDWKLEKIDPSCANQIKNHPFRICNPNTPFTKKKVFLYSPEEFGLLEEGSEDTILIKGEVYSVFNKKVLKFYLGQKKYALFKREKILIFNKQASFSNMLMEPVELGHFDSITLNDFLNLGMPDITASRIIKILIQENIIKEKENCDPPQYELLANFEGVDDLKLTSCRTLLTDTRELLKHCFSFRIAIQKLQNEEPLCKGCYANIILPLSPNLENSLFLHFKEQEIIKCQVDIDQVKRGKLKAMYPSVMNKENFTKLFSNMYDMEKSEEIVEELIKKKWLKEAIFPKYSEMNQTYFKNMICGKTYCMDETYIMDENSKSEPKTLSNNIKVETKTIKLILKVYCNIYTKIEEIVEKTKCSAGSIHWVNVPKLELNCLDQVLNKRQLPTSEFHIFNMNGFDQIISLVEKPYTRAMKIGVTIIMLAAMVEISVGVCMSETFFASQQFIQMGINDISFAFESILSGHCSLEEYMNQKICDLLSFACLLGKLGTGKSNYKSLKMVKEKALGGSEKIKKVVFAQVTKRMVAHVVEGVAYGVVFTLTDKVNQSKEMISNMLVEVIHRDIDNTIVEHPCVQTVKDLLCQFASKDAKEMIEHSITTILNNYKVKLQEMFDSIDIKHVFTIIKRTVSKGFDVKSPSIEGLTIACEMLQSIPTIVRNAISHIKELSNLVHAFLDDLERELKFKLAETRLNTNNVMVNQESEYDVMEIIKRNVKNMLSLHINKNIVSPVVECFTNSVEMYMSRLILKGRKSFLKDNEIFEIKNKRKCKVTKRNKTENDIRGVGFFSAEFDEITRGVLKTRKNKRALAYLMSQDTPMDIYCIELCCKAITLAAQQENIQIPSLKIEVEKDGLVRNFGIGNVNKNTSTLHINQDSDIISNVKNNDILIKNFFKYVSDSFLENHPEYKGLTADFLKKVALEAIEKICSSAPCDNYTDFEKTFENGWIEKDLACSNVCKINIECEKKSPYEHSFFEGGWVFNPRVDVDQRDTEKHTSMSSIQKHVNKGFETALKKINMHIHNIQSCLRYFNLALSDFAATKYQISPPSHDMAELLSCITVQYEIVMPILLKDVNRQVDFNILLRLQDKKIKIKRQPFGPHILYEINPVNQARFLGKGLRGHVLLNMNCFDTSFSIKECHSAGELIIPLALQKPVVQREIFTSGVGGPMNNLECKTSKKEREVEAMPGGRSSSTLDNPINNLESKTSAKERELEAMPGGRSSSTVDHPVNNLECKTSVMERELEAMPGGRSSSTLDNPINKLEYKTMAKEREVEAMPGGRSSSTVDHPINNLECKTSVMERELEAMPGGRSSSTVHHPINNLECKTSVMERELEAMPGGRSSSTLDNPINKLEYKTMAKEREVEAMPGGRSSSTLDNPINKLECKTSVKERELEAMPGGRSSSTLDNTINKLEYKTMAKEREVEALPGGKSSSTLDNPINKLEYKKIAKEREVEALPGGMSTSTLSNPNKNYKTGSVKKRRVKKMPGGRSTSNLHYTISNYDSNSVNRREAETMSSGWPIPNLGYPISNYDSGNGYRCPAETMPSGGSTSNLAYPIYYESGNGNRSGAETIPGERSTSNLGYRYRKSNYDSRSGAETMPGGRSIPKSGYPVSNYDTGSRNRAETETMPSGLSIPISGYQISNYDTGSGNRREAETMPSGWSTSKLGSSIPNYGSGCVELSNAAGQVPSLPGAAEISYEKRDFLVVGDSLFKHISDYITLHKCGFEIFPHVKIDKVIEKMNSLLVNYRRVKGCIIFFGNDIVKTNEQEEGIVHFIVNVVKSVQKISKNVRVVVCTLIFPRQTDAQRWNKKIFNINSTLLECCAQENWAYVDTNRIICPGDFGKDGIHFNRSGYYKLGRHITEECKKLTMI